MCFLNVKAFQHILLQQIHKIVTLKKKRGAGGAILAYLYRTLIRSSDTRIERENKHIYNNKCKNIALTS